MRQRIAQAIALVTIGLAMETLAAPDLIINRNLLRASAVVERRTFEADGCAYEEGCVNGLGRRKLLLVDTGVANIGQTDLVIGDPNQRPDLFAYSPCHDHFHFGSLIRYRLLDLSYRPMIKAAKQGFCLRDDYPFSGSAGPEKGYNCDNQGITAGWQDVYDKSLDCQWIDISGVPRGTYLLEVTVNPKRVFRESNYSNNKVIVRVTVDQ